MRFRLDSGTTPSTAKERELLRQAGFVYVTGLETQHLVLHEEYQSYRIGEDTTPSDLGKKDSNNGMRVVVTLGGEWWLARVAADSTVQEAVMKRVAPNGKGCCVPCSNGETIAFFDILSRIADPDWMPETYE